MDFFELSSKAVDPNATPLEAPRLIAVAMAGLVLLAGCSSPSEPRWATTTAEQATQAAATVRSFDSPRVSFQLQADPDIGDVTFRGTAVGRSPHSVLAPAGGEVVQVFFDRGDAVRTTDDVLLFIPDPSDAELIAVEIAQLEIDKLVAESALTEDVVQASQELDDLVASFDERGITIQSGAAGVIGPTRRNITYSVDQDEVLFEVSDPADVVVSFPVRVDELAQIQAGSQVSMTESGNSASAVIAGTIQQIPDVAELGPTDTVTILVSPEGQQPIEFGEQFTVALAAVASADSLWVPLQAVGRQDGAAYVLIAEDDGRVRRLEVALGRRTLTHVQVLSGLEVDMTLVAP